MYFFSLPFELCEGRKEEKKGEGRRQIKKKERLVSYVTFNLRRLWPPFNVEKILPFFSELLLHLKTPSNLNVNIVPKPTIEWRIM